jgi:hypothetical protein
MRITHSWRVGIRRLGAAMGAGGVALLVVGAVAPGAGASPDVPPGAFGVDSPSTWQSLTPTVTPDCNGIIPTPGSEAHGTDTGPASDKGTDGDTDKAVNTAANNSAGTVHWILTFNTHGNNGNTTTFDVNDCVVWYAADHFPAGTFQNFDGRPVPGSEPDFKQGWHLIDQATMSGVSYDANDQFFYHWQTQANDLSGTPVPGGAWICNFARTTGNDNSGGGNRKTGVACVATASTGGTTTTTSTTTSSTTTTSTTVQTGGPINPGTGSTTTTTTTAAPAVAGEQVTAPPTTQPTGAAVAAAVATTTTVPQATLPFTGSSTRTLVEIAGLFLAVGGLLLGVAGKRPASA